MPMTMETASPSPGTEMYLSAPSLACDLSWVMSVGLRPDWRPNFPTLDELFAARTDLVDRLRSFWPEDPAIRFTEMLLLADHVGALGETSPEALGTALRDAVPTVATDIPLESESPEERIVFLSRLERLKASPELTGRYLDLLRDVWEPVNSTWQAAVPLLAESGEQVVAQLRAGRPLIDLVGGTCPTFHAMVDDIS